ncbi:MAG: hypothetical protein R2706_16245 [Acidimicrobiales bacterium]
MERHAEAPHTQTELEWIIDGLGGTVDGPGQSFLCRPNASDPQLLLPTTPRRVALASMRRFHDGKSTKERVEGMAGQAIGLAGLLKYAPGELLTLPPFRLINRLANDLGEPQLIPTISLGPRRRNRKPVVQLTRPDGVVVGFAKIGWSDLSRALTENEARWLKRVENKLPKGVTAPTVLHQIRQQDWDLDLEVLVSGALRVSAASGRTEPLSADLALAIADIWPGGTHATQDLPFLAQWRQSPVNSLVDLDALVAKHDGVPIRLGLWHGDLTPWNTASTTGKLLIWDWEFADSDRPVGFDLLHMAFESIRRAPDGGEQAAVDHVLANAARILAPAHAPVDAVVDLYLCELLVRETRLAGEGWRPEHLGALEPPLIDALTRRLA